MSDDDLRYLFRHHMECMYDRLPEWWWDSARREAEYQRFKTQYAADVARAKEKKDAV